MKDLYIYHPGTGTLISLSDPTFLVCSDFVDEETMEAMSNGASLTEREHKGWRIDNYNMTNLFFGE